MKFSIKTLAPYIIAIAAFLSVTLVYFQPVIDGKKELRQGDIINYKGASQEIQDYRKTTGKEALWTNSMFSGMPAYQISVQYKANLVQFIDKVFMLNLPHPAGLVFLYFIGFYILLLCLRVDPWLAIAGALAYGFSSYFFIIIEAGHNSKAHAIGYMAPLLGAIILTLKGNKYSGGALTALFMSLELYANHVQITYYLFLLVLIFMVVEFISALKHKNIKNFVVSCAILVLASVVGVLPNISNLWATYEYGKYSSRGKSDLTIKANNQKNDDIKTSGLDRDYATQWSYGKSETFTLLIPNFKGGASEQISKADKDALKGIDPQMKQTVASMQSYFGEQPFTSGPVYIGAIMVFLAVLGLFIIDSNLKWVLFIGTVLSILLSWGKNMMWFSNLFFDYFPAYNKFRAVSMILVLAELTIPLLAVLALERIYTKIKSGDDLIDLPLLKKKISVQKTLFISLGIVGGFSLLCYLAPGIFNTFQAENELSSIVKQELQRSPETTKQQLENALVPILDQTEIARKNIFQADAGRSFVFILLSALLIWLLLKQKLNKKLFVLSLSLLVLVDMWQVAARYLNKENFVPKSQNQVPYVQSRADEFILGDTSPDYRVLKLGNPFNDASTSYFHKSIGGYHGAKLKRYQELFDFHIEKEYNNIISSLNTVKSDSMLQALLSQNKVLNMLNTKYIIYNPEAPPLLNESANGNAWFVSDYKLVENADAEILGLKDIDPKKTAVVNQSFKEELNGFAAKADPSADIKLLSYQPNDLMYESKSTSEQLAVFSEIYYPKGWNAYIDGKLTNHFCADYVLRALRIPAGTHKVEFKFEPKVYTSGERISMIGSFLLLLVVAGGLFFEWKNKKTSAA